MAPEVGAMLDCAVEGPDAVAPVPPPLVWPCEVALVWLLPRHVLPGWCGYATAPIFIYFLFIYLFILLSVGADPMLDFTYKPTPPTPGPCALKPPLDAHCTTDGPLPSVARPPSGHL